MDIRVDRYAKILLTQPPETGLRILAEHAPQAEALAERMAARLRPLLGFMYRARRRIGTAAVGILAVWLFLHVMFGANGMVVYRQKRAEYRSLQQEIKSLQKENDRYNQQIHALETDPAMIEKEAREQLHYARPGEVVYVAPEPPPAALAAHGSARR